MGENRYNGLWWLPENPNREYPGSLEVLENGEYILNLDGSFTELKEGMNLQNPLNPEIILGITTNGKEITLNKCFESGIGIHLPGIMTQSFKPSYIFIGFHFRETDKIKFKEISLSFPYFDEWMNVSGFKFLIPKIGLDKMKIEYDNPKSIKLYENEGFEINVNFSFNFQLPQHYQKNSSIKQNQRISIKSKIEELSFTKYLNIIQLLQDFLILATSERTHPLEIIGKTDLNEKIFRNKSYFPEIDVVINFLKKYEIKESLKEDILFVFTEIDNGIIRNWFNNAERLETLYTLHSAALNPELVLEFKFLSYSQGLESYHGTIYGGEYQTDKYYLENLYPNFIDAIPDNLNNDFKESLKGKLKYMNKFSLMKRLKLIVNESSDYIPDGFFNDNLSKNYFITKVKDTRDYLTHYTDDLKAKAADGEELYELTMKLKILTEICIMKEIEFSPESVKKIISNKYKHELAN